VWQRHDHPPASRADPFDVGRDVSLAIGTVAHCQGLVPQDQGAEKHLPQRVARIDASGKSLRPGQFVEAGAMNTTAEVRIGYEVQQALRLGSQLDRAATIVAVGDGGSDEGCVGLEQDALTRNFAGMASTACSRKCIAETGTPAAQAGPIIVGRRLTPAKGRALGSGAVVLRCASGEQKKRSKGERAHRGELRQPSSRRPC